MPRAIPPGVELWIVTLRASDEIGIGVLRRHDDRSRYRQIVLPDRQRQFAFRRHVQDNVLQRYLGSDYRYGVDASGKPYVADLSGRSPFYFSCSASGDTCVVGVSRANLGVDIERIDNPIDIEQLCAHFFTAYPKDAAIYRHLAWRQQRALSWWCRIEAHCKLHGQSLHSVLAGKTLETRDINSVLIAGSHFICATAQHLRVQIDAFIQMPYAHILMEAQSVKNN